MVVPGFHRRLFVSACTQELELGERAYEAEDEGHARPGGLSGVLHSARGAG